jgi:MFS family permease
VQAPPSSSPGYVAAVLSGLAFLFGLTSLPESLKADVSARSKSHGWLKLGSTIRVLAHPSLGRIVLAVFMTTFAFGLFETTLATLTKRIGVDDRGNFYVFSYIGLVLTLAQGMLVRRLIPKLGELRMAIIGVVLMTVGMFLIAQMASQSQKMRVVTEQIAQMGIDTRVKLFRTENGRFPSSLEELTAAIAKDNGLQLPVLPTGSVYAYDKDRNTLVIASGSSQSISPFWTLIAVLPVIVVGFSATTPSLQSLLSLNSADDEQGEVLGVGQGLSALARIVGPVVGLTLQERNLAYPYWCGGLLMALGIVMVARLKSVTRNSGSGSTSPTEE